jgi:hypothetical protein
MRFENDLRESQVRLDDDVQPARTHKAICTRESQAELVHDFRNADGRGARDADATVDQRCGAVAAATF